MDNLTKMDKQVEGAWSLRAFMRCYRHWLLLGSLVFVAFLRPFIPGEGHGSWLMQLLLMATLCTSVAAVTTGHRHTVMWTVVAVLTAAAQGWWILQPSPATTYLMLSMTLVFYMAVIVMLTAALFRAGSRVDLRTLLIACSVYLLMGLAWATAYAMLEYAVPGSFTFANEGSMNDGVDGVDDAAKWVNEADMERFVGFSYTTLTTLGYGNIAPATPRADALSNMQAVIGQIFIAVVIARLVGIEISQRQADRMGLSDSESN